MSVLHKHHHSERSIKCTPTADLRRDSRALDGISLFLRWPSMWSFITTITNKQRHNCHTNQTHDTPSQPETDLTRWPFSAQCSSGMLSSPPHQRTGPPPFPYKHFVLLLWYPLQEKGVNNWLAMPYDHTLMATFLGHTLLTTNYWPHILATPYWPPYWPHHTDHLSWPHLLATPYWPRLTDHALPLSRAESSNVTVLMWLLWWASDLAVWPSLSTFFTQAPWETSGGWCSHDKPANLLPLSHDMIYHHMTCLVTWPALSPHDLPYCHMTCPIVIWPALSSHDLPCHMTCPIVTWPALLSHDLPYCHMTCPIVTWPANLLSTVKWLGLKVLFRDQLNSV